MKITLNVQTLKCSRCKNTAPIRPQLLYPRAAVDPAFAAPMSDLLKVQPRTEHEVTDDAGQIWVALLTSLPIGWTTLPTGDAGTLCTKCAAEWADAAKAFMAPPPPPAPKEEKDGKSEASAEQSRPSHLPASSLNSTIGSFRSR